MAALEEKIDALAESTSLGHSDLLVGQTALGRQLLAITDLLAATTAGTSHPVATTDVDDSNSNMDASAKSDAPPPPKDVAFLVEDEEPVEDSDDDGDTFSAINKFKLIDKDGSGSLDLAEIISGAKILGLSAAEATAMFDSLDKMDDGTVHMDKFLEVYKEQRATIASKDEEKPTAAQKIRQPLPGAYSIDPRGNFRITWDLAVMMPLLLYLTIMIPFRLSFDHEAELFSPVYWLEFIVDLLFIVDMGFNFCTGTVVFLKDANGEHYEAVEYDQRNIAIRYVKTWFFIDLFSGIPFSLVTLIMGGGGASSLSSANSLKALRFLKLARLLKLGRLLKIEKILHSVDRGTIDVIQDFFHDAYSANTIISLIFAMAFVCHILACGFVAVGKASSEAHMESWLEYEMEGPFSSVDTTGANGNKAVYSIYVASFYFCLTTMVSVGYGDIIPRNNSERIYVIFVEFVSSITFATIIVLITAVVTTLDMGAKMKAEALAEVGSFVDFRKFPKKLARRIRRHFRNFYNLKTASDEKKIFEQLSTSLRKDVSQFLVLEIMGSESFFMTITTSLWPRLLPLLQPMTFEANERVCLQGEECDEMHVVISGILTGSSHWEEGAGASSNLQQEPIVKRTMTKGDSINVLCMLEIWYKCVETVVCGINTVETYSVKAEDFQKLFQTEIDLKNFSDLQSREVRKFKFGPDPEALTKLGRPLYMSCFSTVQIKVVKVVGPVVNLEASGGGRSHADAWVVVDLVDNSTGNPFNEFWDHTTEAAKPQLSEGGSNAELYCGESVRLSDVSVALKFISVRVRVFVSYSAGMDVCVGRAVIPLRAAHAQVKAARSAGSSSSSSPRQKGLQQEPLPELRSLPGLDASGGGGGGEEESKWEDPHSKAGEEQGVSVWCEIKPHKSGVVGSVMSSLLGGGGGSSGGIPAEEYNYKFGPEGAEWGSTTTLSAVELRIFTQTPKKLRAKKAAPEPAPGEGEDAMTPRPSFLSRRMSFNKSASVVA